MGGLIRLAGKAATPSCHPERSEGPAFRGLEKQIPRFARNDSWAVAGLGRIRESCRARRTAPTRIICLQKMENKEIARLLADTADLMEVAGEDGFRVRSYRNAAQAVETWPERIGEIVGHPDTKAGDRQLLAIPGIGKGMVAHLREICLTGGLTSRRELLEKFPTGVLELLRIQGLGPKSIALIWSTYRAATLNEVEQLCREGKIRELPRMGEKLEQKILKAIEAYRLSAGRFLVNVAEQAAEELCSYLRQGPATRQLQVTPAGSLRRGKETVGDLDVLVTGGQREAQIEYLLKYPKIVEVVAKGENKVSVKLPPAMQVDVRFLEPASYGAAMQYFTGSKEHNVALRNRAIKLGLKLSEYGLFQARDEKKVAGANEEEIYRLLGLDYIPPELRENWGELEEAAEHRLPRLLEPADIRGDLHMHTTATDGRASIREMAEAARAPRLQLRRHHRPLESAGHDQWPGRTTCSGPDRGNSQGRRASGGHPHPGRHRGRHSPRRTIRPGR